jgi:hypothetical protein
MSSVTSEVLVTIVTKANDDIETVTITISCESTMLLTRSGAERRTTVTATVTYYATIDSEGSGKTTGVIMYGTTVSGNSGVLTSAISETLPEEESTVL